uniref:RNA helicase n=1 Tax=Anopheles coluzzii TaxID=1518534 RepID=A0A6E8W7X1_ANOCL
MSYADNAIRITRYINPHYFYYKPLTAYLPGHEETQFAVALSQHCEAAYGELYRTVRKPQAWEIQKPGTLVALRSIQLERWIRCLVEETVQDMDENTWYQLWAIDEGIAIKSDPKYVRSLPEAFAKEPPHAKRGAIINVLPSDTRFDYIQNELIQEPSTRWCPGIVATMEGCLEEAASVTMVEKAKFAFKGETIHFGELYVTSQCNTSGSMADLLRTACPKQIITAPEAGFIKAFVKLQTHAMKRFLNNEGLSDKHTLNNFVQKFSRNNLPHAHHHAERALDMDTELSQKVQEWLKRNQEACLAMLQEQKMKEEQLKVPEITSFTAEGIMRFPEKSGLHGPRSVASKKPNEVNCTSSGVVNPAAETCDDTVSHAASLSSSKPSSVLLNVQRHKARLLLKSSTVAQE